MVRVVDGREVAGRYIDAEAYDAFIRGTIAEADGDLDVAAAWYERASEYDPAGVEPRARLGGVLCARNPADRASADKVFARAIEIGPDHGITFVRRARCELVRKEPALAERDARHALVLDPDDGDATRVLADALLLSGKDDDAARVLDGWVLWSSGARQAWRAVAELALRRHDIARWREATKQLANGLLPAERSQLKQVGDGAHAMERIDRAIAAGELADARADAVAAGMGSSTVAVRACAMGRWQAAVQQAELVLGADPADPDALAVLSAVPEWDGGRRSAGVASATTRRVSPLAALVLADALRRRLGSGASDAFLGAYGDIDTTRDPLAAALLRRLRRAP